MGALLLRIIIIVPTQNVQTNDYIFFKIIIVYIIKL